MSWSGLTKFIFGVLLAMAILFGSGVALTRYLLTRLATPPPKPVFANDPSPASASPVAAVSPAPASPVATPASSPSPSPSASPSPSGYSARVTQSIGLIVRQEPASTAAQIGGVEYNQVVTVLEESQDGGWQKVRLGNGTEGWVKSGNTQRSN
ncbi:MAG TPA: SH3 domain-containing protein [Allocoleopsis sp.]